MFTLVPYYHCSLCTGIWIMVTHKPQIQWQVYRTIVVATLLLLYINILELICRQFDARQPVIRFWVVWPQSQGGRQQRKKRVINGNSIGGKPPDNSFYSISPTLEGISTGSSGGMRRHQYSLHTLCILYIPFCQRLWIRRYTLCI